MKEHDFKNYVFIAKYDPFEYFSDLSPSSTHFT